MSHMRKIQIDNFLGLNKLRRYYILGRAIFQSYVLPNGRKKWSVLQKIKPKAGQHVFYLKVNRRHRTSFVCIQRWHDLAHEMGGFIYFVCDNKRLEYEILSRVWFHNLNFCFIPSDRNHLKDIVNKLVIKAEKKWKNISCAMLTPFLHASRNHFAHTYNVDADDIEILLRPELVAKAFREAEKYATEKDMDCINLDMFVSRSFGIHWSFGCVYVRNPKKCLDVIEKNVHWVQDKELQKRHRTEHTADTSWHEDNLDWMFSFLRDTRQLEMGSFYIENAHVAHMPDSLLEHDWAFYFKWHAGFVYHPVLANEYADDRWARIPIHESVYKIDIGLSDRDKYDYLNNYHFIDTPFREHCLQAAVESGSIAQSVYKKYARNNKK